MKYSLYLVEEEEKKQETLTQIIKFITGLKQVKLLKKTVFNGFGIEVELLDPVFEEQFIQLCRNNKLIEIIDKEFIYTTPIKPIKNVKRFIKK